MGVCESWCDDVQPYLRLLSRFIDDALLPTEPITAYHCGVYTGTQPDMRLACVHEVTADDGYAAALDIDAWCACFLAVPAIEVTTVEEGMSLALQHRVALGGLYPPRNRRR